MGYIDIPIETEPVDLADEAFAYLESQIPGWLPSPANLEAWLVEALSQTASELRELTALVPDSIFAYLGSSILGLPPFAAEQATGDTTWTTIDGAGYVVHAGTLVGITPPATSDTFAFQVVEDFTFDPGVTSLAGIQIRALEAGAAASGITGDVVMLDQLDFIETVVLDGPTAGGADAEETDHYLNRLSDLFTLLTPRPILPQDFALLAMTNPSVARATAIDLLNASTGQTGVPRCVTVVLADANGNPVPAQVASDVRTMLQAQREVNFLVFVADPTYTTIDVSFQVTVFPGFDTASVLAQAIADLQAWLSPAGWGLPPFGDPGTASWLNQRVVRYLEVAERLNRTDGVYYIVDLKIAVGGGTLGTADVTMPGAAPLPRPGNITGTAIPAP